MRDSKINKFAFAVMKIAFQVSTVFSFISQKRLTPRIVASNATLSDCTGKTIQRACLGHKTPEIECGNAQEARDTPDGFEISPLNAVEGVMNSLKMTRKCYLVYKKLDKEFIVMNVCTYASFANKHDSTSKLGYLNESADSTRSCNMVAYGSTKPHAKAFCTRNRSVRICEWFRQDIFAPK